MERVGNAVLNFLLAGALGYLVGRRSGGHPRGLRLGAAAGLVSAVAAWVVYGRLDASGELDELREQSEATEG